MIHAGAGLSSEDDTERAAQEAAAAALEQSGIDQADWVVVFATPHHRPSYSRMLAVIAGETGTSRIVGCSGIGVLTSQGELETGAGIAVLAVASDDLVAAPFLSREPSVPGSFAGIGTARLTGASPRDSDLVVLLPDPLSTRIDALLRILDATLGGVPIVGAASSEDGSLGATFQFCGEEIASGGVAGLRLGGAFAHTIGITQGCQPLGEPCIVTRSAGNVIYQIDGRPALAVLQDHLPVSLAEDLGRALSWVAVGIAFQRGGELRAGEYLVRNIVGVDVDRGAIAIASPVSDGESLYFTLLEGDRAREDLKRMLGALAPHRTGRRYRFGLYFNCAARGRSLYRIPGVDTAFLGTLLAGVPIAGFFGNAELAPMAGANRLFTYTGVLTLISEPD